MVKHSTAVQLPLSPSGQLTFTFLSVQAPVGLRQQAHCLCTGLVLFSLCSRNIDIFGRHVMLQTTTVRLLSLATHFSRLSTFPSPSFSTLSSCMRLDFLSYPILPQLFHNSLHSKYCVAYLSKLLFGVFLTLNSLSMLNCIGAGLVTK